MKGEWQPIETAPKYESVLTFTYYTGAVSSVGMIEIMSQSEDGSWYSRDDSEITPNFWMPLPEPPQ